MGKKSKKKVTESKKAATHGDKPSRADSLLLSKVKQSLSKLGINSFQITIHDPKKGVLGTIRNMHSIQVLRSAEILMAEVGVQFADLLK